MILQHVPTSRPSSYLRPGPSPGPNSSPWRTSIAVLQNRFTTFLRIFIIIKIIIFKITNTINDILSLVGCSVFPDKLVPVKKTSFFEFLKKESQSFRALHRAVPMKHREFPCIQGSSRSLQFRQIPSASVCVSLQGFTDTWLLFKTSGSRSSVALAVKKS